MSSRRSPASGRASTRSARANPSIAGMWASTNTKLKGAPARSSSASAAPPPSTTTGAMPQWASIRSRMCRLVALSSTTRTRAPERRRTSSGRRVAGAVVPIPNRAVKWKALPLPTSLSTQMRPPMMLTSRDEMVSPNPVPP